MVSGNEQSWCCTPWHVGVLWGGWPLKANSLVGRWVLVGRRQVTVHTLLSESHSLPSRIKEEAQRQSPGRTSEQDLTEVNPTVPV